MLYFYMYFRYHTLLGTKMPSVGTKTLLYGILKLHTLLGTFLRGIGTKTCYFVLLKLQNALIDLKSRLACLRTSQYTF